MRKLIIKELDVRPILAGGIDPFETIMKSLRLLNEGETLKIINTFEPIPLLNILKTKGYEYQTERSLDGPVVTFIEKAFVIEVKDNEIVQKATEVNFDNIELKFAGNFTEIDVRQLEMPLPMVTILESLEKLEDNKALFIKHKRLPQYLLPELETRGYRWVSKKLDDSNLNLIIYK